MSSAQPLLEMHRLRGGLLAWASRLASLACLMGLWAAPVDAAQANTGNLQRVRVAGNTPPGLAVRLEAAGFDVLHGNPPGGGVQVVVAPHELRSLQARGLTLEVLEHGRPFAEIQADTVGPADGLVPTGYLDRAGIEAAMANLAAAHPEHAQVVDITQRYGTPATENGNHLLALRISDDVSSSQDDPAVLIVSAYHSREVVTPVIALDAARRLLEGHGVDATLTALVDEHEIWIAPLWNPDGYEHVFGVDNLWRKNRRDFGLAGIGVDLNRNADFEWDGPCGGSTSPASNTYRGPAPASEAETISMQALSADKNFSKLLDLHSSGREVLYSYACSPHPLAVFLQAEATLLSAASGYAGAVRLPSAEGEHFEWQLARHGAYAFLLETALQFQPSHAQALAEATLVWPGIVWWLSRPTSLSGHVTDACTGLPLEASVGVQGLTYLSGESNTSGGSLGRYHLYLPAGSYTVEFSAPGHDVVNLPLTVTTDSAQIRDVALMPNPLIAGCWTDLGFGLAGTHGQPELVGSGSLLGGAPASLALTQALENSVTWLVLGIARLDIHPFHGGTLVPDITPPGFFTPLPTDGNGVQTFTAPWPLGVPSGFELYVQHWVVDAGGPFGFSASNALKAVTP